jgi:hypothetical protein
MRGQLSGKPGCFQYGSKKQDFVRKNFKLWSRNRYLSLKNDMNVASKSNKAKNLYLVAILKETGAGSVSKEVRIRGFGSVPKCHGSATLRN